jgi:general secretion pathway protein G
MLKKQPGFTLVELLIALVVVGILAGALLLVSAAGADKAQASRVVSDLRNLKAAAVQYNASSGAWPASVTDLSDYLDGPLECAGPVCYEVASGESGNFVGFRADLSKVSTGVKDRLKGMAETVSLYSDTELTRTYAGEAQAVYPVGYAGSGAMAAVDNALFRARLENLGQFIKLNGNNWSVVNGKLVSPTTGPDRRIAFGDLSWTDYTLSLTGRFTEGYVRGNSGYGIYYRADQTQGFREPGVSGYAFQFDTGLNAFVVRIVTNGSESRPIRSVPFPSGFDIYASHAISVSVHGDRHVIQVDGTTVMDFRDSTYLSGSAGLRTWNKSGAEFSDIVVSP